MYRIRENPAQAYGYCNFLCNYYNIPLEQPTGDKCSNAFLILLNILIFMIPTFESLSCITRRLNHKTVRKLNLIKKLGDGNILFLLFL